jgi:hypothetical protein
MKEDQGKSESVALIPTSSEKINSWIEQIHVKKHIDLSRKALVNWIISVKPAVLPASEINSIIEQFYDEEQYLRRLLRELQKSKKEGRTPVTTLPARKAKTKKIAKPIQGDAVGVDSDSEVIHVLTEDQPAADFSE